MGQDFTKGLNVCIGNYGYYNEGSLHDAWITLPKTEAEIRDFLHLNQLQDSQHEEIYISDYDGISFGTRLLFNEFCHLEDLNLLAKQLVTANPADLEKVGAWIQANDTPESLVGLMNLIEQADDIPFYSWGYDGAYDKDEFGNMIYTTMSPERNYGYEMVEQNEELKHILDSSSQIESAFDYEKYGRAYTEGGEVTVLEDGYIDNCADGPDVDYYDPRKATRSIFLSRIALYNLSPTARFFSYHSSNLVSSKSKYPASATSSRRNSSYVSIPLRFIIAHHPKGRKCPLLCLLGLSCHRSRLNPPFLYFSL